MSEASLLLVLFGIALFALFSGPIGRSSLTPPMTDAIDSRLTPLLFIADCSTIK